MMENVGSTNPSDSFPPSHQPEEVVFAPSIQSELTHPNTESKVIAHGNHRRTEQHIIDAEMNVEIYRTAASPNYYIQFNDPTLGQQKRSLKTKKKKTAESKARDIAAELRTGKEPVHRRRDLSIHEGTELYVDWLLRRQRDEKTLKIHRSFFRQLSYWCRDNGIRTLSQLSDQVLEKIEDTFRNTGFLAPPQDDATIRTPRPNSARTVRGKMKMLLALIRRALKRKQLASLPYADYQLPVGHSEEVEVFSPEEVHLLRHDPDTMMRDIWRMFLFTGARSSELCWLLPSDVSTEPWGVWVRAKTCPLTGEKWFPKKKKERFIPVVDPEAIEHLKHLLACVKGPYLFTGPRDARWKPQTLQRKLLGRLKELGITHGRIHAFRHTVANFLANHPSMTPPQVMEFMGHANIQTTMIYVHTKAKNVQHALKGVDFGRLAASPSVVVEKATVPSTE